MPLSSAYTLMLKRIAMWALLLGFSSGLAAQNSSTAGLEEAVIPSWWSNTFKDIPEDALDAAARGKHLLIFFHLDNCPYCARMVNDHFSQSPYLDFLRDHFMVIDINTKGDLEVSLSEDEIYTEKQLAELLEVFYTPVIIFVDEKAQMVFRIDGYRDHFQFENVLKYVQSKSYQDRSFSQYLSSIREDQAAIHQLAQHDLFLETNDLSSLERKLTLLIIEDHSCQDCQVFHRSHLDNADTQALAEHFNVVRLDALSDAPLVDFEARKTTVKAFVDSLDVSYRPGLVMVEDNTILVKRNSWSVLHHFHAMLEYYASGSYQHMDRPSFGEQRNARLLQQGKTIDFSLEQK